MALICLVLINVGFVIYSVLFDLARPLVNIDYILALLLVAMGWRFIGSLLGGVFLLADALVLISQVFPFPRVNDLIYLFSFLPLASLLHFLLILISVVALVGKLIAFIWIGRGASLKSTLLLLNVLLVAQVYFVYFYDEETAITYRKAEATLIASQSATFMSMG